MYAFHASFFQTDYFLEWRESGRPTYRVTPELFKKFSDKYWKEQRQEGRTAQSAVDGSDHSL
jgi:hypothetical protein